jgi:hypothetical protein
MKLLNNAVVLSVSMACLAGCGGGSGSGDGNTVVDFTKLSDIPDNGITNFGGTSRSASYTADGAGNVTSISSVSGPDAATAVLKTKNGEAVAIRINAPGANVSFDSENGDTFVSDGTTTSASSENDENALIIVDSQTSVFQYQSFGTWLTGNGTGEGKVGVGSFGARTNPGAMPSGTATYAGVSTGFLRASDGTSFLTTSDVTVTTDFSTVTINSDVTTGVNVNTAAASPKPGIDFSGSGSVSGSGFKASVDSDANLNMSGNANGQFYGPNAQEVGGTFGLDGSGNTYIGSFGGKK